MKFGHFQYFPHTFQRVTAKAGKNTPCILLYPYLCSMIEELNISRTEITFGFDSVVVRKFTNGVLGGLTLDVSQYTENTVLAGQVVITNGEVYRPMPVHGDSYGEMPDGFRFFGVVYRSSKVTMGVSVMTRGAINKYRVPYDFDSIMEEFRRQCPMIILASDVEQMADYARLEASDGFILTSDGQEIWFRNGHSTNTIEGV